MVSVFRFCLTFALVLIPLNAIIVLAQQCSPHNPLPVRVQGQVRFSVGGQPTEHVLIRLETFHGGVLNELVTDKTGKYQFTGLEPEYYVVTVHLVGYIDQRREVDLCTANSAYELFQLVPDKSLSAGQVLHPARVINAKIPTEAMREFEKGEAGLAKGKGGTDLQDALRHWESAVRIYPEFLEAQLRVGTAYLDLKQWDKAETALRRAIEINPSAGNAWFALGELYLQQGRLNDGEKALRQGLTVENRSWQGHFALGRLYLEKHETLQAARQIALALQLNPNLADAHLLAGNIFLNAGKREDAVAEYNEYLRLAPNGPYSNQVRDMVKKLKR